jgi:hypothetical protein
MSNPMDFVKGLAGIPMTGPSPYWSAGNAVHSRSTLEDNSVHVGGCEIEQPIVEISTDEQTKAIRYTGLVKDMPPGSVGYTVPWSIYSHKEGENETYWIDPTEELEDHTGGTVQFDVAHIDRHYFAETSDLKTYREQIGEKSEEEIREGRFLRLYTSDDNVILEEIRDYLKSKVRDSAILQKIKSLWADLL